MIAEKAQAALQQWRGPDILTEIHSKPMLKVYKQWLLVKPKTRPRLNHIIEEASKSSCGMLLNSKLVDDYVVVHQTEGYIRELGKDLRGSLSSELAVC